MTTCNYINLFTKCSRTNLPKEVMAFPGFPFPDHLPSFIKHQDVLKYLEDYATHYDLLQYIKVDSYFE